MKNHTSMHLPQPVRKMAIHVKQQPGISYPAPANQAWITESTLPGLGKFHQPLLDTVEVIRPEDPGCQPECNGAY